MPRKASRVHRAGGHDGTIRVHSACAGRDRRTQVSPCSRGWCWKAQSSPKTSHHLPILHAQLRKCGIDLPVGGLLYHSFQQECRLNGSKRERGPHACHLHFPQRSMFLATSLVGPPPPVLAGIQVLSPGASQMLAPKVQGAGLVRGTGRAEVFMLLQAVSSVLVARFRLPQELPQYPRKLRALVDVLVPVAKV